MPQSPRPNRQDFKQSSGDGRARGQSRALLHSGDAMRDDAMDEFFEVNRLNWDNRAELHSSDETGRYRIARVLAGGSSLHEVEAREIGDVTGKDIAHLQCHIGLDTLSLKHIGARSVTGLDFSEKAIEAARDFARQAGTEARFVVSEVYDAKEALGGDYDMVYVTWGTIIWIDDIFRWARVVASLLRPGGKLYLLDMHPQLGQFDIVNDRPVLKFPWRTRSEEPIVFELDHTYTGDPRTLTYKRFYEWIHPLSDVVNALLEAGMSIDFLNEHPVVAWEAFPGMKEIGDDIFATIPGQPNIPLAFSVGSTKRG